MNLNNEHQFHLIVLGVTHQEKQAAWSDIQTEMLAVGKAARTVTELKRKKENWFSEVKSKVRYRASVFTQLYIIFAPTVITL